MQALALTAFDVPPAVIEVPEPVAGPGEAIRRTYALIEATQALQDFANEHTLGKLVITMT
jgi:hypothetical protein